MTTVDGEVRVVDLGSNPEPHDVEVKIADPSAANVSQVVARLDELREQARLAAREAQRTDALITRFVQEFSPLTGQLPDSE